MKISALDLDEEFTSVFTRWRTHIGECNCGRKHICINSYAFSDCTEEEMSDLRSRKNEENVIFHMGYDHISMMTLADRIFVEVCECEGWRPYMNFILKYRSEIRDFLIKVADKAHTALEHEKTFNVLKKQEFNVLDDPPF